MNLWHFHYVTWDGEVIDGYVQAKTWYDAKFAAVEADSRIAAFSDSTNWTNLGPLPEPDEQRMIGYSRNGRPVSNERCY